MASPTRRVPVYERACTVGRITCINAFRANRMLLRQRLVEGGYHLEETPHFLLCTQTKKPAIIVVHWFAPREIDADIGHYFMSELECILTDPQSFGELFGAVVCSLSPHDPQASMRLYAVNTLLCYRQLLSSDFPHHLQGSPIAVFSSLYRRALQLIAGERFLDAGCSFGFLPLLVAEHFPSLTHIVGIDIQADSFAIMRPIVEERQLKSVQFEQADLLTNDVRRLGQFDVVTLLHVLEHFTEDDMYSVLSSLLRMTTRRLLIAVPYENDKPEAAYGHKQLFNRTKLEALGFWCLEQWGGTAQMCYEDCADGLLIIERLPFSTPGPLIV